MNASRAEPEPDPAGSSHCPGSVLAIVNPMAGVAAADAIRKALGDCMATGGGTLEIHETVAGEDPGDAVRAAIARGVSLVAAAGGDGTVSAVANALVGASTPLALIAMGTANVLARELNIPLDLESACRLMVSDHALASVDAMKVGDRAYFTQVGVGLDAMMVRDTTTEHKRRFGKFAYLWSAFRNLLGFQPRRFLLDIDGKTYRVRASEVVVANVGMLGQPPFRWGPDIRVDDGTVDVCIWKARTLFHYLALGWHVLRHDHRSDPNVVYHHARKYVAISAKKSLPVQADGEIVGELPIRIDVVPGALQVIVPRPPDSI